MISGLDLTATVDYTLKDDTENPTVWKLGILPSYVMAKISMSASEDQVEFAYRLLQFSIKGWENSDVKFSTIKEKFGGKEFDIVPRDLIDRLPFSVISELSAKAVEVNGLSGEEIKN
jgi:hypothetical protein